MPLSSPAYLPRNGSALSIDLLVQEIFMKEYRRRLLRKQQPAEQDTFDCDACDG